MKKFHQNHAVWSNETEKKERKVKHRSAEACKCTATFVKLHCHDCPVVNKPCPIHGNHFNYNEKEGKTEPKQSVTVSFYPSLKTERLFQPVKTLLAHCDSETKINFQYYSQRNFLNKETTKDQRIQTSSKDFKRVLNNAFVEKTKSFVADKTNKMKKLKQCFYSPCNSITRKSLSQSSVRKNTNDLFCEEVERSNLFFNKSLEEPHDDNKCDPFFEWFSPRRLDFENFEKSSDDRKDSDFITFTKFARNNVINQKIFEIKHKKGLSDLSVAKFPQQSNQFVYSSFNTDRSVKETADSDINHNQRNEKTFPEKRIPFERKNKRGKGKGKSEEILESTSGKTQSSSSGSVYVTPFFLRPTASEDWDNSKLTDRGASRVDKGVQVEDSPKEKRSAVSEATQTIFQETEQNESPMSKKPELNSVQTLPLVEEKCSENTGEIFLYDYKPSLETLSDKFKDGEIITARDDDDDELYCPRKCSETLRERKELNNLKRTVEVQTNNNHRYKELFVSTCSLGSMRDQTSQTEPPRKMSDLKTNKTQITYPTHSTKGIQTSFSENVTDSDGSKVTHLKASNVEVIIKSSDQQKSGQISDKRARIWYKELSYSDSELHEKKKYNHMRVCICKHPILSDKSSAKETIVRSSCTRVSENNLQASESANFSNGRSTPPGGQKTVECLSKAEQTSIAEEDFLPVLSDLSELKKIILKYFERADSNCRNKPESDGARVNDVKIDCATMTDGTESTVFCTSQKPKKMTNAETQTTVHILLEDPTEKQSRVKFRQSVLLSDENQTKTFFVCALCGREIRRFCVDASTNTDNYDDFPKVKEKTTVIDTKYSKIIEVKTFKKTQNAGTSKEPTNNTKAIPKRVTPTETENFAKTPKLAQNSHRDINVPKSCIPIPISEPGHTYLKNDRNVPATPESRKQQPLSQDWVKCTKPKSTGSQVRQMLQDQRPPGAQEPFKPCICNEIAVPFTSGTSKISSTSTPPKALKTKESKIQSKPDISPSLPKTEHPGVQNSQWRKEEQSSHAKVNKRRIDGYFYPVSIKSFWPAEIAGAWETQKKSDDSTCLNSKQKRSYGKDLEPKDIPAGKKIKAFCDESEKECFLFGKPSFSHLLKENQEVSSKKDIRLIRVPSSSALQVSSQKDILKQFKDTKSEEFVKNSQQRESPHQMKKLDSNTAGDLFTVESCHFKPVTFKYDEEPFSKLFECSVCKSLTYFKTNTDDKYYPWPGSMLSCQPKTPEENSTENFPNELTFDKTSQYDEDFLQECSDFSDPTMFPLDESPKNNIPEENISEGLKESHSESKLQRSKLKCSSHITCTRGTFSPSDHRDVPTTSTFLNTYRFGDDTKKTKPKTKKFPK